MPIFTYITRIFGDVPKLVRGGSAKALFISSSLIVASWRLPLKRGSLFFLSWGYLADASILVYEEYYSQWLNRFGAIDFGYAGVGLLKYAFKCEEVARGNKKGSPGATLKSFALILNPAKDFLGRLFGEGVVLHEPADFDGIDPCVFGQCPADAVADVVVVVLGTGEAELAQERPICVVLVLDLENNDAAANPDVGVANPRGDFCPEHRQAPDEIAQNTSGERVDGVVPSTGLDELFQEDQMLPSQHVAVPEQVVTGCVLDFPVGLGPHVFDAADQFGVIFGRVPVENRVGDFTARDELDSEKVELFASLLGHFVRLFFVCDSAKRE